MIEIYKRVKRSEIATIVFFDLVQVVVSIKAMMKFSTDDTKIGVMYLSIVFVGASCGYIFVKKVRKRVEAEIQHENKIWFDSL